MKTKLFSIAAAVLALVFTSCSSDDENQVVIPTPTPAANGFAWTENGSATVNTAPTATFSTQYKTLMAKDAGNATIFEINLDGTGAATYPVPANAVTYIGVNPMFAATGGEVVITSNANGKVSGTFHATGNGGGITVIDGTFTNIDVIP